MKIREGGDYESLAARYCRTIAVRLETPVTAPCGVPSSSWK